MKFSEKEKKYILKTVGKSVNYTKERQFKDFIWIDDFERLVDLLNKTVT